MGLRLSLSRTIRAKCCEAHWPGSMVSIRTRPKAKSCGSSPCARMPVMMSASDRQIETQQPARIGAMFIRRSFPEQRTLFRRTYRAKRVKDGHALAHQLLGRDVRRERQRFLANAVVDRDGLALEQAQITVAIAADFDRSGRPSGRPDVVALQIVLSDFHDIAFIESEQSGIADCGKKLLFDVGLARVVRREGEERRAVTAG